MVAKADTVVRDDTDQLSEYDRITNEAVDRSRRVRPTRSLRDILGDLAATRLGNASEKQKQVAGEFYEIVESWARGMITLEQARELTGDGWLRAMVMGITPFNHPSYQDAHAFITEIAHEDAKDLGFDTNHGWISFKDLEEAGGRRFMETVQATGEIREVIQFPVGVNPNTGQVIWPNRAAAVEQAEHPRYISPFRADWFDDMDDM